jgi:hypothetical protein
MEGRITEKYSLRSSFHSIRFNLALITKVYEGASDAEVIAETVFFFVSKVRCKFPIMNRCVLHPKIRELVQFSIFFGFQDWSEAHALKLEGTKGFIDRGLFAPFFKFSLHAVKSRYPDLLVELWGCWSSEEKGRKRESCERGFDPQ